MSYFTEEGLDIPDGIYDCFSANFGPRWIVKKFALTVRLSPYKDRKDATTPFLQKVVSCSQGKELLPCIAPLSPPLATYRLLG